MLPHDPNAAVARARAGDDQALSQLFEEHRARLIRLVEMRMDASLRRRLDPADVVQEAWLAMVRRVDSWRAQPSLAFAVWARLVTREALIDVQRRHLGTQKRDAQRESTDGGDRATISAVAFSDVFVSTATSPTQALRREEIRARVLAAVEGLEGIDREILALRHFEGLTNEEAAEELDIDPAAASKRFVRALTRLRPVLSELGPDDTRDRT